jgi:hypothetical protein
MSQKDSPTIPQIVIDEKREHTKHMIEIDMKYGDTAPYHADRVIQEVRFLLNQSAEAMLEAGRRLILIKEHEEHGEWLRRLNSINLDKTVAARMMQAAVKFSNVATSQYLSNLNKSKLIELMVLDDDEIHELLDEGGSVRNLKIDDVERMSVKELRAALRKQREETDEIAGAKDRMIMAKNKQIDDLAEKLERAQSTKKKGIVEQTLPGEAQLAALQAYSRQVVVNIEATLRSEIMKLYKEFDGDNLPRSMHLAINQSLGLIITAAYGVAGDLNLEPVLDPDKAANDPIKQDAEDFLAWEAEQDRLADQHGDAE